MSDINRLLAAFETGELCRPDASQPNFVDLVQSIATLSGVPDLPITANARAIADRIGRPQHLVFVLADGLGAHAFEDLPPDSWLRTHLDSTLQSVFPPTTGAAITSLATGTWPSEHGVVGWWTYLSQLREAACLLPFTRPRDGVPLLDCGVTPEQAFGAAPLVARMDRPAAISQPRSIIDSTYSSWFGGGAATLPYDKHAGAVDAIVDRIRHADRASFTYWYTPAFDHEAHEHGAASDAARAILEELDDSLADLADALSGLDARIVLTADHGHVDAGARFPLDSDDPLLAFLRTPPSGDMRLGFYHLQDNARQAFSHEFQERFGDHFALITAQELDDLRLLGPEPLAKETRRRVGDFASLALDDSVMRYTGGSDGDHFMHQRSHHSGLSHREMTIPLVIG